MARLIQHIVEPPRACSYIPPERASLEHHILLDVDADELEALLERGFRRFGPDYFRPVCPSCTACVPTRILTSEFKPSRSQRRARNRGAELRVVVGPPRVDEDRLALYHAWHGDRERAREWTPGKLNSRDYFYQFAFPHPSAREVAYYDDEAGGRLVAIGICDETPRAWSAVYCFYDPAYAWRSPGVGNVLTVVDIARAQGKPYVYLGYRVAACPSLRYKSTFHPQEILPRLPEDGEPPRWVRVDDQG
ncbi:arginyltransferase [Polyangium spumosum]|uniref:Aspartate/glutamate leucyltransferase n=1 Tax=Polyangium spumosum TaxID=889282 RepID=A0A6N7PTP9_9BACT|nr:arginyltransferase [Polyangium spumosum]MRG92181.1 arginyltransferase [Polyangium spumosum]